MNIHPFTMTAPYAQWYNIFSTQGNIFNIEPAEDYSYLIVLPDGEMFEAGFMTPQDAVARIDYMYEMYESGATSFG